MQRTGVARPRSRAIGDRTERIPPPAASEQLAVRRDQAIGHPSRRPALLYLACARFCGDIPLIDLCGKIHFSLSDPTARPDLRITPLRKMVMAPRAEQTVLKLVAPDRGGYGGSEKS